LLFLALIPVVLALPRGQTRVLNLVALGSNAVNYVVQVTALLASGGDRILAETAFLVIGTFFLQLLALFSPRWWVLMAFSFFHLALGFLVFFVFPADLFGPWGSSPAVADQVGKVVIFILPVFAVLLSLANGQMAVLLGRAREANHRLSRLAFTDSDTNLPNGPALERDLAAWDPKSLPPASKLILAAFRLEGLDTLNSLYGPDFTTQTVQRVAQRWKDQWEGSLRADPRFQPPAQIQWLYRVEGSIFLFAGHLPAGSVNLGRDRSRRALTAVLQAETLLDPRVPPLRFHGGYALYPDDGVVVHDLVRGLLNLVYARPPGAAGDFAPLNRAAYDQFVREESLRLALLSALRAPETREFHTVFQPKVSLVTRRVVGFEALLRWKNPGLGSVPPSDFVPVAERHGLLGPLTLQVCEDTFHFLAGARDRGVLPGRVSVNLSPALVASTFLDDLMKDPRVAEWGPHLELEITEGIAMVLDAEARRRFLALRNLGITFSIDDFGTGYSNLASLQEFDAEVLKIDKRFIDGLPGDPQGVALVRATVDLARAFGMQVVAEGVENARQFEFLRAAGCDQIQGYFASRPLPPDQAVAYQFEHPPRVPDS